MNGSQLHLTLRQLHEAYSDRRVLSVLFGVGILLGILGPFGTYFGLNTGLRIIYWMLMTLVTFAVGFVGGQLAGGWLVPSRRPLFAFVLAQAAGASVPVTLVISAMNAVFFSEPLLAALARPAHWFYAFVVSVGVFGLIDGILVPVLAARQPAPADTPPPLLERLPHEVRGPLSHLSMADHYVEVFTARGKAMVLLRLADAIRETGDTPGLQNHRSHWVARDAIKAIRKEQGKVLVETRGGALLPVSRSYLAAVRALSL